MIGSLTNGVFRMGSPSKPTKPPGGNEDEQRPVTPDDAPK